MDEGKEAGSLAEAVGVLEQVISRMVVVLEHQGRMLRELLEASSRTPKEETRLDVLIAALVDRLDRQAGVLEGLEARFERIGAAVERGIAVATQGLPGGKGQD